MKVRRHVARRTALGCLLAGAVSVSAGAGSASAAASKSCQQGRTLLQCNEKVGIYDDSYVAALGGFGDLVLFETKLPLPIGNPALSTFWRYQAATSIARQAIESTIINQESDEDIEHIAKPVAIAAPVVHASGIIDRRTATALSSLLRAEQQQIVNLAAMNIALNRATAAQSTRTRTDWVKYQQSAAAGDAIHAAAATQRMIKFQAGAERALTAKNLLFGVGPVDLSLAKQAVKRTKRFAPKVSSILTHYGLSAPVLAATEAEFLLANLGPTSVSLTQYLSSSTLVAGERDIIKALHHYAARIPRSGRPPTG